MNNSSDYNLGIQELINRYEGMVKNHTPIYFDSQEFIKIYEFYLLKERYEEAENLMTTAWNLYPTNSEIVIAYSDQLIGEYKMEEAYQVLSKEGIEFTEDIYMQRGEILLSLNKKQQAEEEFDKAAEEAGYDIQVLIQILIQYTEAAYTQGAEKYVKLLEEKHPIRELMRSNKELRDTLSSYYMLTKQEKKNYEIAKLETELDPYSYTAWGELATSLAIDKQYEKANEAIDFALAIEPKDEELLDTKLSIILESGTHHEIIAYLQSRIREEKESIKASLKLIDYYTQTDDYYDAYTYGIFLLKHREINSDEKTDLLIKISESAILDNKERLGHQYAILAIHESPSTPKPYAHYGWCWLSFKESNAAMANRFFDLALHHTPSEEKANTLYNLGLIFFKKEAYREAISFFEQIMDEHIIFGLKIYPYLLYCYYVMHNREKAIHCLRKIKEELPLMFIRLEDFISNIDTHNLTEAICALRSSVERSIDLEEN